MAPPANWSFEDTLPMAKNTVEFTRPGSWTLGRLYETMHEEGEDDFDGESQKENDKAASNTKPGDERRKAVRLENAHDALADARALAKVWPWLVRRVERRQRPWHHQDQDQNHREQQALPSIHEHYENRFRHAAEAAARARERQRQPEEQRERKVSSAGKETDLELLFVAEQQEPQHHHHHHHHHHEQYQHHQQHEQQQRAKKLSHDDLLALLASPVTSAKGVGEKTAQRLRFLGLESCGDLLAEFQGNCGSDAGLLKAFLLRNRVGHPSGVMRIVRWVVATDTELRASRGPWEAPSQ